MASVTLADIPDDLFERLKARAAKHGRTPAREAVACLAEALAAGDGSDAETGTATAGAILAAARRSRAAVDRPFVTDAELRKARDEGRP